MSEFKNIALLLLKKENRSPPLPSENLYNKSTKSDSSESNSLTEFECEEEIMEKPPIFRKTVGTSSSFV
jgi:hypothetical protein